MGRAAVPFRAVDRTATCALGLARNGTRASRSSEAKWFLAARSQPGVLSSADCGSPSRASETDRIEALPPRPLLRGWNNARSERYQLFQLPTSWCLLGFDAETISTLCVRRWPRPSWVRVYGGWDERRSCVPRCLPLL